MHSDAYCRFRAEQCLARIAQQCGEALMLMPQQFETEATLAYTYQTTNYLATGDVTHALSGNGPILVSRLTGAVAVAGTALPITEYIREFEAEAVRST